MTKIMKGAIAIAMSIGMGVGAAGTSNNVAVPLIASAGSTPSGTWSPITSPSDVNTSDDFLLSYTSASGTYYGAGTVSSKALTKDSSLSNAKTVQFVSTTGGYFLKLSGTKYLNNSSGTDLSAGDSGSSVWEINSTDLCIENTSNGNRFLGGASDGGNIKAYATSGKNTYPNVHVYKQVFSVTYKPGDGTGTDYVINNVSKGSYTLISFATSGFVAPSGQRFKCWSISSTEYSAGANYTISGAITVTAIYEDIPSVPYINLTLNSGLTAFTGQTVSVSAEYGNGVAGLTWTVQSGSTSDVVSSNLGYSATIGGSSGTLTIRATDTGSETYGEVSVTVTKVSLSLNKSSSSINRGESETLTATHNANAVGGVNWSSNNAKVTVENGVISVAYDAVLESTATITATSAVDTTVSATCIITVSRNSNWNTEFSNTMVSNIELPDSGDTANKYYVVAKITSISSTTFGNGFAVDENGTAFEIYGMYNLNGQMRYDVMYESQKPIVDDIVVLYGKFTKHNDGPEIKNAWVMQRNSVVFEAQDLTGVTLNKDTLTLNKSGTYTLKASPAPLDAVLGAVTWASSNTSVATVNGSGKVTAVSYGVATITATAGGFSTTCLVEVMLDGSIDLKAKANVSASSELLAWTVSSKFDMKVEKHNSTTATNNYCPDTPEQTYTSTRFYKDSKLTLTPASGIVAVRAIFTATSNSYATTFAGSNFTNATAVASGSTVTVTFTNGNQPFEAIVANTCGFETVKLVYEAAEITIQNSFSTRATLSYGYTKLGENSYSFDDVAIRFGGLISVDLWNRLNTESTITGYGVMLSTTAHVTANGGQLKNLTINGSTVVGFEKRVPEDKEHPVLANAAQKDNLVGDYYIWNLYNNVPENFFTTSLTAVTYIKTSSGNVYFEQVTVSVQSLASSMVAGGADTLEGSLNYLASLA